MKARKTLMSLCLLLALPLAAQQKNYVSEVWVADQGNGKYKNPVLYADYSDPDACRVGDDYYMTSSSFNCLPGLQILHSFRQGLVFCFLSPIIIRWEKNVSVRWLPSVRKLL